MNYHLTQALLSETFSDIPNDPNQAFVLGFRPRQDLTAVLHQVGLEAVYNHPTGLFAQGETLWYGQSNEGYAPGLSGADFWQFNAYLGYRFLHRQAELRLGLLNIGDRDYRLNPLTLYNDLPRRRTLAVRLQFNF